MNREQFIQFVNDPETLDSGTTPLLENLVKEYPYCQTAEILYALNLNRENNFRFNTQLRTAAAYAPDRKRLKQLVGLDKTKEIVSQTEPEIAGKSKELQSLIDQLKGAVESILTEESTRQNTSLYDLASKLEHVMREHHEDPKPLKPDIKDYNFGHLSEAPSKKSKLKENEALIDKFIREEPSIEAPQKAEFFNPVDYAKHGLEDNQEIVSETLAKVYLKQGNPEKAIKIYDRLRLVYPEKSSFFAAQIKKIKEEQSF